ncbi:spore protein [Paenibacillus alvei]|jgi:hypothetical protein|uniref:Spore protein n=3 Tax=Paenibacillus TaxID=44249 RepID=A0AAJ2JYT2_9BACL|nr:MULTISPECIES: hypothetical protein [Paenibacillus]EJW19610.1 hypothetical protein PAV_1c05910 [Paenibacillus alvei DSM 29]MCM3291187.1 spore protein [Paenibacillus sp. MER 180]MCY7485070.1 spore protein [Paenibacillus alvei]MCY9532066.1 spore protein [Paenibacillus alvei]MCY9541429.1 spore protein [Paenibacillus alvei]
MSQDSKEQRKQDKQNSAANDTCGVDKKLNGPNRPST